MPEKIYLHLVLTFKWFDETVLGDKRIEYREMTQNWTTKIWDRRDKINRVRFQRGYTKNPPTEVYEVTKIDIGSCPIEGWDGQYYRIHFVPC